MITFRTATLSDIPLLHALIESGYRGDAAKAGWTHEADLLGGQRTDAKELRAIIMAPENRILLGETKGSLMGCVQISDKGNGLAYLGLLTVDPAHQASGLGRQILAGAEKAAMQIFGARHMEMTVIGQREELIAWYARRGYLPTGEERPFPYDEIAPDDAYINTLYFRVLQKTLTEKAIL
jgi:predicted GNAT family N-acyltransferase